MKRTLAVLIGLAFSGLFLASPALATPPKKVSISPNCTKPSAPPVPESAPPVEEVPDLTAQRNNYRFCFGVTFEDTCDGVKVILKSDFRIPLFYKINDGAQIKVSANEDKKLTLGKETLLVLIKSPFGWLLLDTHKWVQPKACSSASAAPSAPLPTPSLPLAKLPVTGSKTPMVLGIGLSLIVAGAVVFIATRRKRDKVEFVSE